MAFDLATAEPVSPETAPTSAVHTLVVSLLSTREASRTRIW